MEITQDEFKSLCDDIDVGGTSRELSTHHEVYKILEFIASNQKSFPVVLAQVNKYLATPEHRNKGFQVLYIVLKYLPMTLAEEKAIAWSNFAVEFNRVDANSERFFVLAKLIEICSINANADFNRHVTTGGLLKRIIDKCLSLPTSLKSGLSIHFAIVHLINVCVQTYPGSCGNYKVQIDTFLVKYLDVPNKEGVIEEAGACLHYLQQTGPAGPNQTNYVNNWRNQLQKICATIHYFYDHLFEDDGDMSDITKPEVQEYKFEHMNSCDSLNTAMLNGRRLKGLIKFLEEMLRNPYPVEKQIHSNIILGVIQKGLSLRMCDENKYMIDNYNNHWILEIKLNVLQVLKHWINIMERPSAMFQPIVFDMLINSMKNIDSCSIIYREYQLKLYNVFAFYINRAKPAMSQKYHEQIIQHLLKFIKPAKINVELNIDISIAGKSAKGKKRSIDQRIIDSGKSLKIQQEADADKETREKICVGALKTLNKLFETVHVKISEKTCTYMFGTIISILNALHESCPKIPYDDESCQVELYNVFLKLYDQPFLPRHLSLSLGIMYFTCAQNKSCENVRISDACEKAIYILEKTCQPMCASLYEPRTYYEGENGEYKDTNKTRQTENHEFVNNVDVPREIVKERISEANNDDLTANDSAEIQMEHDHEEDNNSEAATSTKSKFNVSENAVSDFNSTIVYSPAFSTFSSCASSSSASKTVNILTETVIASSPSKILENNLNEAPPEVVSSMGLEQRDKELLKSPLKSSPQVSVPSVSTVDANLVDVGEQDDNHSIFSKETCLNTPTPEENGEDTGDLTIQQMIVTFVAETNF